MTPEEPKQDYKQQRLDREHFAPGIVPQDAIYGAHDCLAYYASATKTIPSTTITNVDLNTIRFLRGDSIKAVGTAINIQEPGFYLVVCSYDFSGGGTSVRDYGECIVYANGNTANRIIDQIAAFLLVGPDPFMRGITSTIILVPSTTTVRNPYVINLSLYQATAASMTAAAATNYLVVARLNDSGKRLYSDVGF